MKYDRVTMDYLWLTLTFYHGNRLKGVQMSTRKFINVTLVVSALAGSPVVMAQLHQRNLEMQVQNDGIHTDIISDIASVLYNKGLEKEVAEKLTSDFIKGREESFARIMETFTKLDAISKEQVLEYFSMAVLFREDFQPDSYTDLSNAVLKMTQRSLDEKSKKILINLSKQNV